MRRLKLITLSMLVILSGCGDARKNTDSESIDIFAMDTYMNLRAYGKNVDKPLTSAGERIYEIETRLSATNEYSDISKINNSDGEPVTVNNDTRNIIEYAIEMGDNTDGLLDITIFPVLREWGFTTGNYKIPEDKILDGLLENVDYTKIITDGNNISVPSGFQIDTGALTKGYTGDEVMKIFKENGIESAIINLGGNVQTLGRKPDNSLWKVAVKNPFQPDSDICILQIENKAVITSGNYERFFIGSDGKKYHHIIDPTDGRPAENGLVSVTIVGENGLMCDALSTALFISGYEKAVEYWRMHSGFDMILVTDDGKIYYTDGLNDSFTNVCNMPAEVISHDEN